MEGLQYLEGLYGKRKVAHSIIASRVKVALELWKELLPVGCMCFVHAWLVLSLVYVFCVCLFVSVSGHIMSAIITSHNILLPCHAARLYFGRLDGCFEYWCSYYE